MLPTFVMFDKKAYRDSCNQYFKIILLHFVTGVRSKKNSNGVGTNESSC